MPTTEIENKTDYERDGVTKIAGLQTIMQILTLVMLKDMPYLSKRGGGGGMHVNATKMIVLSLNFGQKIRYFDGLNSILHVFLLEKSQGIYYRGGL